MNNITTDENIGSKDQFMLVKPRTMAGALELLPRDQAQFDRIKLVIERNFRKFGFVSVDTPAIELSDVLLCKEGGETEKQVYFVQSSGSLSNNASPELALRFDLTVPLARYVAEHQAQLRFPFKRFQIQKVYRGERSQRGRFREFYQCDIDVVGQDKLPIAYDAELPAVVFGIFKEINIGKFTIHINNRRLVKGFLEVIGVGVALQSSVLREVDKLDKRGLDYVKGALLEQIGLEPETADEILRFISKRSISYEDAVSLLDGLEGDSEDLRAGKIELKTVLTLVRAMGVPPDYVSLNFSVMRGLDYYTGTVYETYLDDHVSLGSVCSGGRYENLASHYTDARLPGVGISIGLSRLFWQLRELGLLGDANVGVQVVIMCVDENSLESTLALASELRRLEFSTQVLFGNDKLKRQLKYAVEVGARMAVFAGSEETQLGIVSVRDLCSKEQVGVALEHAAAYIGEILDERAHRSTG
jgi:histidyl-tRNA synthetase